MKYRRLDENNDYSFGHGLADFYIDEPQAVGQSVATRLRLWQGEYFLDLSEGTPYQTEVLGFGTTQLFDQAIQDRILETEGVDSMESYESNFNTEARSLDVNTSINTIYGDIQLEDVFRGRI